MTTNVQTSNGSQRYIQVHGRNPLEVDRDIRTAMLYEGKLRHAAKSMPVAQVPISENVRILNVKEAIHGLYMAARTYYLGREERGLGIPRSAADRLYGLYTAYYNANGRITILSDALDFFTANAVSVEDAGVRAAITAAQLTLRALQDSYAELPIVSVKPADPDNWML